MVSRRRYYEPGLTYHILNRAVLRQCLFKTDELYEQFEELIAEVHARIELTIYSYQLMPNHWHFVVRPRDKEQLSDFFHALTGTQAKRFRSDTDTLGWGHVYQDRFKSLPVQNDGHFLSVCRYVERNALRAGLVERAEHWHWGSTHRRLCDNPQWLTSKWPVPRPIDWIERVNQPMSKSELEAIDASIHRGRPLGSDAWVQDAADRLGLTHTLRERGRPRRFPNSRK